MRKYSLLIILFFGTYLTSLSQGVFNIFEALSSGYSESWFGGSAITSWDVTTKKPEFGISLDYQVESSFVKVGNDENPSFFNIKFWVLFPSTSVFEQGAFQAYPKIDTLGLPNLSLPYTFRTRKTTLGLGVGKDYYMLESSVREIFFYVGYTAGLTLSFHSGEYDIEKYNSYQYQLDLDDKWKKNATNRSVGIIAGFKTGIEFEVGSFNQLFFEVVPTYFYQSKGLLEDEREFDYGHKFLLRANIGFRFYL